MRPSQRDLLHLLSLAIRNRPPKESFIEANWQEIYQCALEHNVHTLFFPMLQELNRNHGLGRSILSHWETASMLWVRRYIAMEYEIKDIVSQLSGAGLPVIILKGVNFASLYPYSELRVMGDVDLLVHEKDEAAAEKIFRKNRYQKVSEDVKHKVYEKDGFLVFELHTRLINREQTDLYYQHLWKNAIVNQQMPAGALSFSLDDNFIYLLIHMAKHMQGAGTGLRSICDLVLMVEKYREKLDVPYINESLDRLGLLKFASWMLELAHTYFDLEIPPGLAADVIDAERKEPACLMDLIIKWGDHGVNTKKNLFLVYGVSIIKKNRAGRRFPFRHHLSTLFPKMDNMKGNYAYIQNCPGLLAFAWFHRLARTIKNRLVLRRVTTDIKEAQDELANFKKMFKELGLGDSQIT